MADKAPSGSRERLLHLLKTRGPATAPELAELLGITPVAVRQHLGLLADEGLVAHESERRRVGRPVRVWHLTDAAAARFPESYADLAVGLLASLEGALGARGLQRVVAERTRRQIQEYRAQLPPASAPLAKRVAALARLRAREGYMAEHERADGGALRLVENHCPICAAATVCQGLCSSELELFRAVLGPGVAVEREEHILDGARRCAYRIEPA